MKVLVGFLAGAVVGGISSFFICKHILASKYEDALKEANDRADSLEKVLDDMVKNDKNGDLVENKKYFAKENGAPKEEKKPENGDIEAVDKYYGDEKELKEKVKATVAYANMYKPNKENIEEVREAVKNIQNGDISSYKELFRQDSKEEAEKEMTLTRQFAHDYQGTVRVSLDEAGSWSDDYRTVTLIAYFDYDAHDLHVVDEDSNEVIGDPEELLGSDTYDDLWELNEHEDSIYVLNHNQEIIYEVELVTEEE